METPKNKKIRDFKFLVRQNNRLARTRWPSEVGRLNLFTLRSLTRELGLSLASGEILLLNSGWYVTDAGLLRLARDHRCAGIRVQQVREFCDPALNRWVFKATVFPSPRSKGFVGYGDPEPSNVSSRIHGAKMRAAETLAVNRAQ